MARYHSLLIRTHKAEPWAIEFGDYDRCVVKDEKQEYDYSGEYQTRIICTSDKQADIESAVASLNRHLV